MFKKVKESILFILIFVILPILASFVVEVISNIVTMEIIVNFAYIALGILIIYFLKAGIE